MCKEPRKKNDEIERVEGYDGDIKFVGEHNYHNNAPAILS